MPRYIKTDKLQDTILTIISLNKQIAEGTLEYAIQFIVDNKIDIKPFEKKIKNDKTGRPAWNPKVMLKIVLFAYSRGIISSRGIEKLCKETIIATALAENSIPDFTVIADFISGMKEEIKSVFINILLTADEMNLLGGTRFALDGCKLQSNASKEMSGKFADLEKKAKKIEDKINYLLDIHKINDKSETIKTDEQINLTIKKLEKKAEKIKKFIKENEIKKSKRSGENQSNITDNESAKMKSSHGIIQGYNGQAFVDDKCQIIAGAEVFGQGGDSGLIEPMIETVKSNFKELGKPDDCLRNKTLIADTAYYSEKNLASAYKEGLNAYIPDTQFRNRDPRFKTKNRHNPKKKNPKFTKMILFIYDAQKDIFVCKNAKVLKREGKEYKIKDWTYKRYVAKQAECSLCPIRKDCLEKETTRRRSLMFQVKVEDRNYSADMIKKIDTVKGREIYSLRMQIVEPVFANMRYHKKMNRFTLRTREKVNIQWLLYCSVHNISKIARYGKIK